MAVIDYFDDEAEALLPPPPLSANILAVQRQKRVVMQVKRRLALTTVPKEIKPRCRK